MIKIFMNGCCGRMGHTIANMCKRDADFRIVAGCDVTTCDDFSFPIYNNPQDCTEDFDVIIDFAGACCGILILKFFLDRRTPQNT